MEHERVYQEKILRVTTEVINDASYIKIHHLSSLNLMELISISKEIGPLIELTSRTNQLDRETSTTLLRFRTKDTGNAIKVFTKLIPGKQIFRKLSVTFDDEPAQPKIKSQVFVPNNKKIRAISPYRNSARRYDRNEGSIRDGSPTHQTLSNSQKKYVREPNPAYRSYKSLDPKYVRNTNTSHQTPKRQSQPESTTRIFCTIPTGTNKEEKTKIENQFFDHFRKFGLMDYYEIATSQNGQQSYGYIQYYTAKDARQAINECNEQYTARYAREKRLPRGQTEARTRIHPTCGGLVSVNTYLAHEKTCDKQYALSKVASSNRRVNLLFEPKPSEPNTDEELNQENDTMDVDNDELLQDGSYTTLPTLVTQV